MNRPLPRTFFPFFLHFLCKQKLAFLIAGLTILAWPMMDIVIPYVFKHIIEVFRVLDTDRDQALHDIKPYVYLLISTYLLAEVMFRLHDWVMAKAMPRFRAAITTAMFNYAKEHSHRYFSDRFAGSVANQVTKLSSGMSSIISDLIIVFMPAMGGVIGGMVVIALIMPAFGIAFAIWFLCFVGIGLLFLKRSIHYSHRHSEAVTTLNGKIVDLFSNVSVMRSFSRQAYESQYFNSYQEIERITSERLQIFIFKNKMVQGGIGALMCCAWWSAAIYCWYMHYMTLGQLTQIILQLWTMIGFSWFLMSRFSGFFEQVGICKEALSILSTEHELKDTLYALPLQVTDGEIIFDQVHFHYISGRDIFRNKNLTIRPSEKIGLVGFSGSGKTTFAHLILRLFDVEAGRILIDGQDIRSVTQESLRNQIALVSQDSALFHRTLMENIRYGRLDATDEEVIEAAKQAHCHAFIMRLEKGYDTLVGERGVKLSGGQRQRVAIARALLKNARILIMDEATSSLDSLTEAYIQDSLEALLGNRTTIVIAHRLSTLSRMDRILVFEDGEIIEEGSHSELIAQSGHYAMLWNRQAGGFLPDQKEETAAT